MRLLWRDWPAIKKRLLSNKKKLLMLDFDGTLVSIAPTPDEVSFCDSTKRLLRQLVKKPGFRVSIISGRSLKNLRTYFDLKNVVYVGNHGLEMEGLALPLEAKKARRLRFTMWLLVEKLNADFYYLPGILIEDKGLTISLHFRNLPKEHTPAFGQMVEFFKKHYAKHPLAWRKGKKVWEVFPKIRWHKGFAAVHLLKKYPGSLPIVIGDDRTDEDMFKAMGRFGLTIRVGRSRKSHAQYYLDSQKEVDKFLEELSQC